MFAHSETNIGRVQWNTTKQFAMGTEAFVIHLSGDAEGSYPLKGRGASELGRDSVHPPIASAKTQNNGNCFRSQGE